MKRKIFNLFVLAGFLIGLHTTQASALEWSAEEVTTEVNENSSIEQIREELNAMDVYVLDFKMTDGAFPTFDVVTPPEGCNGLSITNNEYVTGSLNITLKGEALYQSGEWVKKESGVKVKVRGNTSTAFDWIKKKGYKVKLEKKADLLFRDGSDGKDKEWVLLGKNASTFNFIPGFQLGRVCGLGWQPELRHVAVIMNDQYIGCYYLCEAVAAGKHKVNIDDSGYIIENDAYWWKPEEVYFKTNHQPYEMGWTFKEPDTDDFDEMSLDNIKWVVNTVEKTLYNKDDVSEMIDYETFAKWVLAQDIMNSIDPCGTNMFIKKDDFNHLAPFESKLSMGPLWDFDGCFVSKDEKYSLIHTYGDLWFAKLFAIEDFKNVYTEQWKEIRSKLKDEVMAHVEEYIKNNPDYYKLLLIDDKRGTLQDALMTPADSYQYLNDWFDQRIPVLNKLILGEDSGIEDLTDQIASEEENLNPNGGKFYTVDGLPASSDSDGILIKVEANGKTTKIKK